MALPRAAFVAPCVLLAACEAEQMARSWQIDRLRVLAVAAEPAEPRPGDVVTFSSLTVSPAEPWGMTVWMACFDPTDPDLGCDLDPDALEGLGEDATIDDLAEAGVIGVEPYWPPTWTVPEDALAELSDADALEGVNAFVNLAAFPETDDPAAVADEDVELAYKRVPVSLATTPNHNPAIVGLTVDGVEVPAGTRVTVDHGQTYVLEPLLAEDAVEDYTFVNADGVEETRTEEPYLTWYTQEGSFDASAVLYPSTDVEWTAPADPELAEQSVWVVIRDRRGGMGWLELPLTVR